MSQHWTHLLLTFALQHLWHSALLFALMAVVATPRRFSAEARSWLLAGAFVLAAASPMLVLLPGAPTPAPSPIAPLAEPVPAALPSIVTDAATMAMPVLTTHRTLTTYMLQLAAALWLAGTLLALTRLLAGVWQAKRLHRTAQADDTLKTLLGTARPAHTYVAVSEHIHSPMVVGLLRPRILVPRPLQQALSADALRDLLLHEAAHVQRRDLWASATQRAVLAVFWWSPFLRLIGRQLDAAREAACDARAALQAGSGRRYAESLLSGVAALVQQREHRNALAVGMSVNRSGLTARIEQLLVLDAGKARRGLRLGTVCLCLLALGIHTSVALAVTPRLGAPLSDAPRAVRTSAETAHARDLVDAAADGDVARIQQLVRQGVPVDATVRGDGTALISAAANGQLAAVDALLALGAQPDLASRGDGNPLIAAAARGRLPVVQRLVAAGADVNRHVPFDETPLINAARSGDVATVAFLVERGADVNLGVVADGGRWRSPYNQARNAQVREYLVRQGAVAGRR